MTEEQEQPMRGRAFNRRREALLEQYKPGVRYGDTYIIAAVTEPKWNALFQTWELEYEVQRRIYNPGPGEAWRREVTTGARNGTR